MSEQIDWSDIGRKFRAPFDPQDVDFRPQTQGKGASGKAQAVCYVSARVVMDRLDEVVGPGAWSFSYEPIVVANGQVQIAKGRLTVHGVTKEDAGEANNFDPSKACVSDAIKRAAVMWGIGRYLYDIGGEWVTLNQYGQIAPEDLKRLRAKLPRPDGKPSQQPVTRPVAPTEPAPEVAHHVEDNRPVAAPATQAPASAPAGKYNALADTEVRKPAAALGYGSVDRFETFMDEATGGDRANATRAQLLAYAEQLKASRKRAS